MENNLNSISKSESEYTKEGKIKSIEFKKGDVECINKKCGLFAVRTLEDEYKIMYCGNIVSNRRFKTPKEAAEWLKRDKMAVFEIMPVMLIAYEQRLAKFSKEYREMIKSIVNDNN